MCECARACTCHANLNGGPSKTETPSVIRQREVLLATDTFCTVCLKRRSGVINGAGRHVDRKHSSVSAIGGVQGQEGTSSSCVGKLHFTAYCSSCCSSSPVSLFHARFKMIQTAELTKAVWKSRTYYQHWLLASHPIREARCKRSRICY